MGARERGEWTGKEGVKRGRFMEASCRRETADWALPGKSGEPGRSTRVGWTSEGWEDVRVGVSATPQWHPFEPVPGSRRSWTRWRRGTRSPWPSFTRSCRASERRPSLPLGRLSPSRASSPTRALRWVTEVVSPGFSATARTVLPSCTPG